MYGQPAFMEEWETLERSEKGAPPMFMESFDQEEELAWGAFHLAKISGSTGYNANGTSDFSGNFPEQMDNLRSCSTFFGATNWNGNMPFHLHNGEIFSRHFQCPFASGRSLTFLKMAEMVLREGEKKVGLQEDVQKCHDEGT